MGKKPAQGTGKEAQAPIAAARGKAQAVPRGGSQSQGKQQKGGSSKEGTTSTDAPVSREHEHEELAEASDERLEGRMGELEKVVESRMGGVESQLSKTNELLQNLLQAFQASQSKSPASGSSAAVKRRQEQWPGRRPSSVEEAAQGRRRRRRRRISAQGGKGLEEHTGTGPQW